MHDGHLPAGPFFRVARGNQARPVGSAANSGPMRDTSRFGATNRRIGGLSEDVAPVIDAVRGIEAHIEQVIRDAIRARRYCGDASVAALCSEWISLSKGEGKTDSTVRGYRYDCAAWCAALALPEGVAYGELTRQQRDRMRAEGGAVRLRDLDRAAVERAIDRLSPGRWNPVTLCLGAMFRALDSRHEGIAALAPRPRRYRGAPRAYPAEVWAAALRAVTANYRDADVRSRSSAGCAALCVYTGLRLHAGRTLEWPSVDFDAGVLRVVDKGVARVVVMDPATRALLTCQPRRGRWVWPSRDGARASSVSQTAVGSQWRRARDTYGGELVRGLRLHQVSRHALGCAMDWLTGDRAAVQHALGHTDPRTTDHYVPHAFQQARAGHKRAEVLGDLLVVPFDDVRRPA